jgi:two-component system response regulator YesN
MARHKVFLIDDEKNIVQGLKLLIDWAALNCEIVGDAEDGKAGIELIRRLEPDIVISDIRMPYMTGLQMIEQLRDYPHIRFIILSGYSDFAYAKTGIALGVTDYVLKPVDENELIRAVQKAISSLEEEKQRDQNLEMLQDNYSQAQAIAQDYVMRDFVNSYFENDEEALMLLRNMDMLIAPGSYTALYFELSQCKDDQVDKLRNELQGIIRDVLHCESVVCKYTRMSLVAIVITAPSLPRQTLLASVNAIHSRICRFFDCSLTIGVGNTFDKVFEIPQSTQQAIHSLAYKMVRGVNSVNAFSDTLEDVHFITALPDCLWDSYKDSVSKLDVELLSGSIDRIFETAVHLQKMPLPGIRIISLNMMLTCISQLNKLNTSSGVPLENMADIHFIFSTHSADALRTLVKTKVKKLIDSVESTDLTTGRSIIARIRKYLSEHIYEDLSLISISQAFHLSPVYLSQLFKKETHQLFIDYITNLKIEKAKELLNGGMMVYEVAEKLGYKDTKYFSRLFEKRTGQKPTDFKRLAGQEKNS